MRSSSRPNANPSTEPGGQLGSEQVFLRKAHSFVGLYLFFFLWLFTGTGLLLNHSQWSFTEFWANRQEADFSRTIAAPAPGNDLNQAQDLMQQLGLTGEVEWTRTRADSTHLDFRVSRPGRILEVKADLAGLQATVHEIRFNGWGIARVLHTFSGVRMEDARNQRDWILTTVWAFAMDATAVGTILLVLTSLGLWVIRRPFTDPGWVVLGLGILACGWFCFGLRWLY